MKLLDFYQKACKEIADGNMNALAQLSPPKPEYFNWVEDFFYPSHVGLHAEDPALIWRYKEEEKIFSFSQIYDHCNQLVNFLRKHGISQKDTIYTMLPLVPENWISFMATIKGGFILMPTATNLVKQDLVYRFDTLFPEVIIAQDAYAERIDEAENEQGKEIKLKIILGKDRAGWLNFDDIFEESAEL